MSEVSKGNELCVDRKICFRHSCRTKYIGSLNKKLTEDQKACIKGTPFAWLVDLKDSMKISRNLLTALVSRWVEMLGGFDMGREVVEFSLLDVCLGLGLRVVGENIDLNKEGVDSECKNLFGPDKVVDIDMLYDYIVKHINDLSLISVCKLYLVLAILEFLLPNRSGRVFSILFNIADDICSICKYNWGGVVYEYLVRSICEAKMFLRDRPTTKHFHLVGCVYLLQLWSFDHFLIVKGNERGPTLKFPRMMNRMDVRVGDHVIKRSLKENMVVIDVAASVEELTNSFAQEGFEEYGRRSKDGSRSNLLKAVERQEAVLLDLQKELLELKSRMNEKKEGGHNPVGDEGCSQWGEGVVFQKVEEEGVAKTEDDVLMSADENYPEFVETTADVHTPHTSERKEALKVHELREGGLPGDNSGIDESVRDEIAEDVDVQTDEVEPFAKSNMYARRRHDPRKRFKSCAIRTPFATYRRRKHPK